ncbi:MAG TPA: WD40 repeat domain-containing protein [Polyangia bacterium]|nr:WD40 repeat domain-containing protein [Polyangia bacterium]
MIDFRPETARHQQFFGREDLLGELQRALLEGPANNWGWILVKGAPGRGKSALVSQFLRRFEEVRGFWVAHHFLRQGMADWARPERVAANLAARIESFFPEQRDAEARPESRLIELLERVSRDVLLPERQRLLLVIDELSEAEQGVGEDNPLPRFLPHVLPEGVIALCSSSSRYRHLTWLERRGHLLHVFDLDSPAWSASNAEACRRFWRYHARRGEPRLNEQFVAEALRCGEGNILYAVALHRYYGWQLGRRARVDSPPLGLDGLLGRFWDELERLPEPSRGRVMMGLGILIAARESLPLSLVASAVGWEGGGEVGDFLRAAHPLLEEEPHPWTGEAAYRPLHEHVRDYLGERLGPPALVRAHERLTAALEPWLSRTPPEEPATRLSAPTLGFRRRYALRYGVAHALGAGDATRAARLCIDVDYLEARAHELGAAVFEDVARTSQAVGEEWRVVLRALHDALRSEARWITAAPEALPALVFNRLRAAGWSAGRIAESLAFPTGLPALRLRNPVRLDWGELLTLRGHFSAVSGCAVTPDGRYVISTAHDWTLQTWDLSSGERVFLMQGHAAALSCCALTPDGQYLVTGSWDYTLKVWKLPEWTEVALLRGHSDRVSACAFLPGGRRVVSTSWDGTVRLWDVEGSRELAVCKGHTGRVSTCAVTPDGRYAISGGEDHLLRVWDLETGVLVRTFLGHSDWVRSCAFFPDGSRLVSTGDDRTARVWDFASGQEVMTLAGHSGWVLSCAVAPDGRRLFTGAVDKTIKMWDLVTGQEIATLKGHSDWVGACVIFADGHRVVSASWDETLKVWDVAPREEVLAPPGHTDWVSACAAAPAAGKVVSASWDRTLKVWDVATGRILGTWRGHGDRINTCVVTPAGDEVVSASDDRTLRRWDLATGEERALFAGHADWVRACAVTPDGKHLISAADDRTVKIWDLVTGQELATLRGHEHAITSCAVTPDGTRLVTTSIDRTVGVWDLTSRQFLRSLTGHTDRVWACAVTPDGRRALSASFDKTLRLWDLESGAELRVCRGHVGAVRGCAILPGGRHAVSAAFDRTLRLWDLESGSCVAAVYGVAAFLCVEVMPGGIAAGDALGNVWLLEADLARFL